MLSSLSFHQEEAAAAFRDLMSIEEFRRRDPDDNT